jgi:hypothetical protein
MKKSLFSLALFLFMAYNVNAQNKNQLSFQLSLNQVELAYLHRLSPSIWGEVFVGTGNQDINSSFDDFAAGVRIGYDAFSNRRSMLGFNTCFGIYIPDNDYYNAITPVIGAGIRYTRVIGKSGKHNLFVNTGFQYGKRDYRQEYASEIINASTIGTFKIVPLYFSLGYGFNF